MQKFKAEHGRMPTGWEELVVNGVIGELPQHPYGGEWVIMQNGRVFSTSKFAEKASGSKPYRKQILVDIEDGLDLKDEVFSLSILGNDDFIDRVKNDYLESGQIREQLSARSLQQYQQQNVIIAAIEKEIGKELASLINGNGNLRRIAMDLLYRFGGLKGPAIGALLGIDYSAVSHERKRLRERLIHDQELSELMKRLECSLSTIKI